MLCLFNLGTEEVELEIGEERLGAPMGGHGFPNVRNGGHVALPPGSAYFGDRAWNGRAGRRWSRRPPCRSPCPRCGAAIYQVYVRSFREADGDGIGDLRGVTQKLGYIALLNVDALWLSPFHPSPQKDFGCDISDMRNVDPRHGNLEDFAALLEEAHARDLKVMLDFVPCHTSEEHPWFVESRSSRDNDKADWYIWADGTAANNGLSSLWRSTWTRERRRSRYHYHTFLQCPPALDLLNPEVMDALTGEMRVWLDLGGPSM